jgi:FkbM family methyltransferase
LLARRKFFARQFTRALHQNFRKKGYPPLAIFSQDYVGTNIFLEGFYELHELECITKYILPKMTHKSAFLDIGANVGNHTAALAPFFEQVIAFEPNPRTSKLLEANAMLFSNVSVRSYGLSNEEGIIQTSYSDENVGGASVTSQSTNKNKVEFHLKRLDDQLPTEQRSSVSLIKLDVEGHEYEVLCGAVMTLKESSPLILFEINVGEIKHGSTKAKEFLYANGYTYFYHLKDVSPFANTAVRLSKLINALSVLFFGKKLRGKLIPHRVKGKLKNKTYPLILASKYELPFE